jgi:UDP-N-acetylglucosamine 2-epimerase (non-hydrolysing)
MAKRYTIYLVGGARPNFPKIAPLWEALTKRAINLETKIVHTGQHYDYAMSQVFFDQLGLPRPHRFLDVGSGSHAYQTAQVMLRFEELAVEHRPDLVVVVGDVNSTLAVSLTSVKLGIPVAHVEAGLRSFDRSMPEEINRMVTDTVSTLLFATERSALDNLAGEGMSSEGIHLVGNVMIDSLKRNLPRIREDRTVDRMGLRGRRFVLATIHRPTNVDTEESLFRVLAVLRRAATHGRVILPAHPRTVKNIEASGLRARFEAVEGLSIVEPLGYVEFLNLLTHAWCVLTDSGGIQEETTWLGIPCITLRANTERPITVEEGTNRITGLDLERVSAALDAAEAFDASKYSPPALWDGKAGQRICRIIGEFLAL